MAKLRYIKDSFWTDPYIERLSPDYKLIFLYLLTNPLANIAGVYEIRIKRMAYEVGYDTEVVENAIKKFVKDLKIIQFKEWIVIVNHVKHQSLGNLTAEGINRVIKNSPLEVQELFEERIITNSKDNEYSLLVLKENHIPLTSPLYAPTNGALSKVKYSNSISIKIPFEDFWKIYPKKTGKVKSEELWKKLSQEEQKLALEDIPKRKEDSKWLGGFIKDPERYIKYKQWQDEIKVANKAKFIDFNKK